MHSIGSINRMNADPAAWRKSRAKMDHERSQDDVQYLRDQITKLRIENHELRKQLAAA